VDAERFGQAEYGQQRVEVGLEPGDEAGMAPTPGPGPGPDARNHMKLYARPRERESTGNVTSVTASPTLTVAQLLANL
jgi:hypothetical protein